MKMVFLWAFQVGIKNRTSEVQLKLSNIILVDAEKNQVKLIVISEQQGIINILYFWYFQSQEKSGLICYFNFK